MAGSGTSLRTWGIGALLVGAAALVWQRTRVPAPSPAPTVAGAAAVGPTATEAAAPVARRNLPARPPAAKAAAQAAPVDAPSQPNGLVPVSPPQNEAERRAIIATLPEITPPPRGDPSPPIPAQVQELSTNAVTALNEGDLPRAAELLKQAEAAADNPTLKEHLRARRMNVALDMGDTKEAGRLAESLQGSAAPETKKAASDVLARIQGSAR